MKTGTFILNKTFFHFCGELLEFCKKQERWDFFQYCSQKGQYNRLYPTSHENEYIYQTLQRDYDFQIQRENSF